MQASRANVHLDGRGVRVPQLKRKPVRSINRHRSATTRAVIFLTMEADL